jgi:ribonuclease R
LDDKSIQYYTGFTELAAKQSSDTEVKAMEAERTWNQVKMCEYMAEHIGDEFTASISSVTSFGFYVELPNLIEGLVPMRELKDDYYQFDDKHYFLLGRRTKRTYRIGDTVKVKLAKVDLTLNHIDFTPVEDRVVAKKQPNKANFKRKRR